MCTNAICVESISANVLDAPLNYLLVLPLGKISLDRGHVQNVEAVLNQIPVLFQNAVAALSVADVTLVDAEEGIQKAERPAAPVPIECMHDTATHGNRR